MISVQQIFNEGGINLPEAIAAMATEKEKALSADQRVIGALEETSLAALLDYLADLQHLRVEDITHQFCDRFNIAALPTLPADRFEEAVKYLVDQMPNESITTSLGAL